MKTIVLEEAGEKGKCRLWWRDEYKGKNYGRFYAIELPCADIESVIADLNLSHQEDLSVLAKTESDNGADS